ncbi:MAG: hypothetical protein ACI8PZ_005982 [Myxococcota bacterium]|jgi:hypothetical protein
MLPTLLHTLALAGTAVDLPPDQAGHRPPAAVLDLRAEGTAVRLVNASEAPQRVLPTLDGSRTTGRTPQVLVRFRDAGGASVRLPASPRCGNTNPLRDSDWVQLGPGEGLQLLDLATTERPDGAVAAQVVYSTFIIRRAPPPGGSPRRPGGPARRPPCR